MEGAPSGYLSIFECSPGILLAKCRGSARRVELKGLRNYVACFDNLASFDSNGDSTMVVYFRKGNQERGVPKWLIYTVYI